MDLAELLAHAGGGWKAGKALPMQFGRTMAGPGIEMIRSYSPVARGRFECRFGAVQAPATGLAHERITWMEDADCLLKKPFWPCMSHGCGVATGEQGSAVVPLRDVDLGNTHGLSEERTVTRDHSVSCRGRQMQLRVGHVRNSLTQSQGSGARATPTAR